jgi:hypothetical protein
MKIGLVRHLEVSASMKRGWFIFKSFPLGQPNMKQAV